jgi:hypothetical protein
VNSSACIPSTRTTLSNRCGSGESVSGRGNRCRFYFTRRGCGFWVVKSGRDLIVGIQSAVPIDPDSGLGRPTVPRITSTADVRLNGRRAVRGGREERPVDRGDRQPSSVHRSELRPSRIGGPSGPTSRPGRDPSGFEASRSGLIREGGCHILLEVIPIHQAGRVEHHADCDKVMWPHEPIGSVEGQGDFGAGSWMGEEGMRPGRDRLSPQRIGQASSAMARARSATIAPRPT